MATPFLGEIRIFAGNFAPVGWNICDGSLLPISEFEALFNLMGTTYGGNGTTTFALPDLRGRVPVHQGAGFVIGQTGGEEQVTVSVSQMPAHTHSFGTDTAATTRNPGSAVPAVGPRETFSGTQTGSAISPAPDSAGGNSPHNNIAPTIAINYILALQGIFPSQG